MSETWHGKWPNKAITFLFRWFSLIISIKRRCPIFSCCVVCDDLGFTSIRLENLIAFWTLEQNSRKRSFSWFLNDTQIELSRSSLFWLQSTDPKIENLNVDTDIDWNFKFQNTLRGLLSNLQKFILSMIYTDFPIWESLKFVFIDYEKKNSVHMQSSLYDVFGDQTLTLVLTDICRCHVPRRYFSFLHSIVARKVKHLCMKYSLNVHIWKVLNPVFSEFK